jgi:RNA polymerase sigma factor (sigma-70 family)
MAGEAVRSGAVEGVATVVVPLAATETFEGFYRRELRSLVTFAAALAGPAYADDIAQEAMLAAYRRWDVVSGFDLPVAWVRKVCANRAVSALRRRASEGRALVRLGARRETPITTDADSDIFWAEVRRLPARQAQCIALAYVYDLGVAEIAVTLGISVGSVKTHLFRGRATLAARLAPLLEETP